MALPFPPTPVTGLPISGGAPPAAGRVQLAGGPQLPAPGGPFPFSATPAPQNDGPGVFKFPLPPPFNAVQDLTRLGVVPTPKRSASFDPPMSQSTREAPMNDWERDGSTDDSGLPPPRTVDHGSR